jgi:hypothetical protein
MDYLFPFDTCEKPNKVGIAQPYSSLFNLINCIIILFFLYKTKKKYTFYFLFSIFLFQLVHLFSHMIHIQSTIQLNTIHIISYIVNITLFYVLYSYSGIIPSIFFFVYLVALILFDMYSFFNLPMIYYVSSQTLLFSSFLSYYHRYLPDIRNIIATAILFLILIINEKYNCETMLSMYPNFPFHIFVEITGIVFFYLVCSTFYKL